MSLNQPQYLLEKLFAVQRFASAADAQAKGQTVPPYRPEVPPKYWIRPLFDGEDPEEQFLVGDGVAPKQLAVDANGNTLLKNGAPYLKNLVMTLGQAAAPLNIPPSGFMAELPKAEVPVPIRPLDANEQLFLPPGTPGGAVKIDGVWVKNTDLYKAPANDSDVLAILIRIEAKIDSMRKGE